MTAARIERFSLTMTVETVVSPLKTLRSVDYLEIFSLEATGSSIEGKGNFVIMGFREQLLGSNVSCGIFSNINCKFYKSTYKAHNIPVLL